MTHFIHPFVLCASRGGRARGDLTHPGSNPKPVSWLPAAPPPGSPPVPGAHDPTMWKLDAAVKDKEREACCPRAGAPLKAVAGGGNAASIPPPKGRNVGKNGGLGSASRLGASNEFLVNAFTLIDICIPLISHCHRIAMPNTSTVGVANSSQHYALLTFFPRSVGLIPRGATGGVCGRRCALLPIPPSPSRRSRRPVGPQRCTVVSAWLGPS